MSNYIEYNDKIAFHPGYYIKEIIDDSGLTQEDLAMKSGVGLCFVRNLEQGKSSLRMDKVNQLLDLFNYELTATKK